MRVLHVLDELRPSGAEVSLKVAAPHWDDYGIRIDVLATGANLGIYADELYEAGYGIVHFPMRPLPRFVSQYVSLLLKERYDVVHIHVEQANFYLGSLARAAGVPRVVFSVHNVFRFEGYLRLERMVQRAVMRRLGMTFVAVSPSVEAMERRQFRNPSVQIVNWFDHERCRPPTSEERRKARTALSIGDDEFAVVSVGNCSPVKNHAAALRALARLHPNMRARYIHVGQEQPGAPERVLARELGIAEATAFLGSVKDVVSVIHAADCYVMPSLHEGIGIATLEAFGCGLPGVLSDVPGLWDFRLFSAPVTWVTPEAESIADGLEQVARLDPAARARLGADLSDLVHANFSVAPSVRQYASVYVNGRS